MSPAVQRARIHTQQGRYEDALRELGQAATQDPDDYQVFGLRSIVLANMGRTKEAVAEGQKTVTLAPDHGWSHYVLGIAQLRARKTKLAEESFRKALAFEPENPEYHHSFGRLMSVEGRWKVALQAADRALELDPSHEDAQTLRAQALSYVGTKAEAKDAALFAVSENPESADAHAELGWVSLRHGDRKQAIEHFKESLRLDPRDKIAQRGLLETLRAGFPPYRFMLSMTFAIGKLPRQHQSGVILLLYVAFRAATTAMRNQPNLTPILLPIAVILGTFYFMRWFGELLTDAILLFHPLGRLALGPTRRLEATVFSVFALSIPVLGLISAVSTLKLWTAASCAGVSLFVLGLVHNVDSSERSHKFAFWGGVVLSALLTGIPLAMGILVWLVVSPGH